mgnify:CR=1 FL=1
MTVSAVSTVAGGIDTNTSVATTASFAWQNNVLYTFGIGLASSPVGTVSTISGGGLTFALITTTIFDITTKRLTQYQASTAANSLTEPIWVKLSKTHSRVEWNGESWAGQATDRNPIINIVGSVSTNASTALLVTVGTVSSGSATCGVYSRNASSNSWVTTAGFARLAYGVGAAEAQSNFSIYSSSGATAVKAGWVTNASSGALAFEVAASSAGGAAATIRQLIQPDLCGTGGSRFLGNLVEFIGESQFVYEN